MNIALVTNVLIVYHIHEFPVPTDGNCTGTGGHLDPFVRGELPPCDSSIPMTCQVGDLSGKHGNITDTSFSASYTDVYISTEPGTMAFAGDLSVVVHDSTLARLACMNITATPSDTDANTNEGNIPTSPDPGTTLAAAATVPASVLQAISASTGTAVPSSTEESASGTSLVNIAKITGSTSANEVKSAASIVSVSMWLGLMAIAGGMHIVL